MRSLSFVALTILAMISFSSCSRSGESIARAVPAQPVAANEPAMNHSMPALPKTLEERSAGAMLFDNLGTFHRLVTTSLPEARQYFDQGMRLMYAFNHDESTRSLARAATLDPTCAMCGQVWFLSSQWQKGRTR